jgi:hypothetical protein
MLLAWNKHDMHDLLESDEKQSLKGKFRETGDIVH